MNYKITYVLEKNLPRLGWIASVDTEKRLISVIHGEYVECTEDWMVEGIWDGEFGDGNFHESEVFFGSGMRIVGDSLFFITSSALTDRILLCETKKLIVLSNSLLLLLAWTDSSLDEEHSYRSEAVSIARKGVKKYDRKFRVINPEIKYFTQVFYENILIKDGKIEYRLKKQEEVELRTYENYYDYLIGKIEKIKINYKSADRKIPIKTFTTMSSGYDSTAVSALVKNIDVKECFSGNRIDGLLFKSRDENVKAIAHKLGYKINKLDTKRKSITKDELDFLSTNYPKGSNSVWSEISLHSMVKTLESQNQASAVFTGYAGGHLWDANLLRKYRTDEFKGYGALSGLNLTEIRLKAGFFNVPISYILRRRVDDIVKISNSKEMAYWKLNNEYDKPIARRIVEEAGVDRKLFGMEKHHITTTYLWPINKDNRKMFFKYLKTKKISKLNIFFHYFQKRFFKSDMIFSRNIDFYDLMRKWATELLVNDISKRLSKYKIK